MSPEARPSRRTQLFRQGFVDVERAEQLLERLDGDAGRLLALLARTTDPDAAAGRLVELAERIEQRDGADARQRFLEALADDEGTAMRLLTVLGASVALGQHLLRHPEQWAELTDPTLGSTRPAAYWLRGELLRAVGADPDDQDPVATLSDAEAVDRLRVEYRRLLLRLASRDLAHELGVDDVAAELSDLAAATLEAALAVARARVGERASGCRLAVIAMGKCGGHELNYVSDVDVVFVAEPAEGHDEQEAVRVGTKLASNLMKVCSDHTGEGTIWPVDAALRPEGKAGPLVRTLASHVGYYERWAKTWEFQALLKARPVAGDLELGREYARSIAPMVWQAAEREGFVPEVQAMRRRVVAHIPAKDAERQIKLGSGGLRDVEFAVQLLQMVHGRYDDGIRQPTTLSALAELTARGYVGRDDGASLHDAYRFLRTVEHRMQLHQLRRTHVLPDDEVALRRLGRSLGYLKEPVDELERVLRHHRREVRRLHEKLFYRPLLESVARIPGEAARLTPEAARTRLAALGYLDPDAALRHLEALTSGVSRTAAIQRTLLPVMLEWFADTADPDAALLGFRRISEALGRTHWYLALLRDEGEVAERMAVVLGSSRFATDLLQREPAGVKLLASDELVVRGRDELLAEMSASWQRQDDRATAIRQIRAIRRRELLRVAAADLSGLLEVEAVGRALTDLTCATLEAALAVAVRAVESDRGRPVATRIAVVSMGRLGGHETSYASDADVMFVHEPLPGADPQEAARGAQAVANELRSLLGAAGSDPPLVVDADLRPEGKQGPLVRTLDSYAGYYARWSAVWEAQALLRAEAVIGDEQLGKAFVAMIDPLRYPADGLGEADVREVRRIKARVDDERLPRGADPATHLKLGRGGLSDIEWTVQLLQMRHAGSHPELRTTETLRALEVAAGAGLLEQADAEVMAAAWRLVSRVRNALTLVRGKPLDQLPRDTRELATTAALMGYEAGETDALVNDYLRCTRRARSVVERLFWG
ncbi:bifunctional [glutamine synthetase] adenylyltransferase/[glutamine synthetase]-adenylyl-L-tyrosine phosphorylase [Nocardioides caldifontis]|uniref:bifunctional [glutamine synthetase] adenylyltransferase/[glutamine synthetase]-adenylyl-L-tyrosine phosphorylase n=1 Tax=Nocardioides caldifontis TaxID=2588938 RepID=UPI0011DF2E26|nr:bifunctional [glutamine synthetase] adenylyltransferase/[glutamine synthetase]-adenylyl-L-tyrosine phosphorylase [Nocardioides caldifontis]